MNLRQTIGSDGGSSVRFLSIVINPLLNRRLTKSATFFRYPLVGLYPRACISLKLQIYCFIEENHEITQVFSFFIDSLGLQSFEISSSSWCASTLVFCVHLPYFLCASTLLFVRISPPLLCASSSPSIQNVFENQIKHIFGNI